MRRRFASALLLVCAAAAQNQPGVFRIQPVRPVAELRVEALAAKPPAELGSFRKSDLVDLAALDPRIKLDIRYATPDNFLSTPVYSSARALLQRPAAEALLRAHRELTKQGYGLLISWYGPTPSDDPLQQLPELFWAQAGISHNAAHGMSVNRIMSWGL